MNETNAIAWLTARVRNLARPTEEPCAPLGIGRSRGREVQRLERERTRDAVRLAAIERPHQALRVEHLGADDVVAREALRERPARVNPEQLLAAHRVGVTELHAVAPERDERAQSDELDPCGARRFRIRELERLREGERRTDSVFVVAAREQLLGDADPERERLDRSDVGDRRGEGLRGACSVPRARERFTSADGELA